MGFNNASWRMVWKDHLVKINVVYFKGYLLEIGLWKGYQDHAIWVIWLALTNTVFSDLLYLTKVGIHPVEFNGVCIPVIDPYSKALLIPWESFGGIWKKRQVGLASLMGLGICFSQRNLEVLWSSSCKQSSPLYSPPPLSQLVFPK